MTIKQLSIFLENKTGRINDVTRILGANGINMHAFSMAETTDFGILRLIVSEVEKAVDVFVELLESTLDLIKNCKCRNGCPSCIYSPKCGNDNKPLHKKATEYILQYMLDEAQKNNSE